MKTLSFISACLTLLTATPLVAGIGGANPGFEESQKLQRDQLNRLRDFMGPKDDFLAKRQASSPTINFTNPAAQQFFVDGTTIPDVNFDAGPSWSGLLPISGDPNETRKLFFWFWPTSNITNADKLLFWTNGGPGCSSLEGFLQENGPISWSWGQSEPTPNQFAWTQLAHMLWVEQPVGTGFSQGTPNITNDDELAAQITGFFGQFLEVFSELKGLDFYLSGESYAGFYVPYIANFIYENPGLIDLNLKGISIADPSLSYDVVQDEIPALRFARAHEDVFPFTDAQWAEFQNISDTCGYTDYLDQFVTYPPAGQLPFPAGVEEGTFGTLKSGCRLHSPIQEAVGVLNPVFDVYRVTDTWPSLWSVLGFPESTQQFIYFNRSKTRYMLLTSTGKFVQRTRSTSMLKDVQGNDQSIPSMLSIFPNVIEKSERVIVVHGLNDFILVAEGTRIAIQNMTWNGAQGFQTPIENQSFTVENFGVFGNEHTERGLTYVEFYYSGHMTPQFVPWAAFNGISFLLGLQPTPSS
ncbi:alpha/beta-hydrolase [Gymnopus androsaceus JB14]|uniref:Carboxypeptidase n=1 Tax=Gymnopus androsaceus JB14 TaxID=1447944 RepID=A0A6A4IG30_9AGAR|nr:alpha/beta-hydrolase [Gymnopus androsaceus JB14]